MKMSKEHLRYMFQFYYAEVKPNSFSWDNKGDVIKLIVWIRKQ